LQSRALVIAQLDFVDLLDARRAQFHRHSHEQAVDAVFAFEVRRTGQDLLFVLKNRFGISTAAADGA
jgi:hypothetical protein